MTLLPDDRPLAELLRGALGKTPQHDLVGLQRKYTTNETLTLNDEFGFCGASIGDLVTATYPDGKQRKGKVLSKDAERLTWDVQWEDQVTDDEFEAFCKRMLELGAIEVCAGEFRAVFKPPQLIAAREPKREQPAPTEREGNKPPVAASPEEARHNFYGRVMGNKP